MRRILVILSVFTSLFGGVLLSNVAYAANAVSQSDVCQGVGELSTSNGCSQSAATSLDSTLALVLNLFSAIVGIVAVIMIIIAGVKYVTSSGNPEKTNEAKDTILYAIIGIIIVILAQIIVKFVLHKANAL